MIKYRAKPANHLHSTQPATARDLVLVWNATRGAKPEGAGDSETLAKMFGI